MVPRHLSSALLDALDDRPVVLIHGPRQAGKTTLVRSVAETTRPARYLTLDDAAVLAAAKADPAGFIAGLEGPVVLDEVQRVPELFPAIKVSVDRNRRPGRFLLTGSADVLLLPRLSESLAGRMEILTLWPLSLGEIEGVVEGFVDALFGDTTPSLPRGSAGDRDVIPRILRGGYPELLEKASEDRRRAWFGSYLTSILQRDVRDLSSIEDLSALPRLLSLLASRPMALLNFADLARSSGLAQSTLKRYLTLLEATFLFRTLPAWFANLGKRLTKAPKTLLTDTGLLAHLLALDAERLKSDRGHLGGLLENLVVVELTKQLAWSAARPGLFHYRTHQGDEVDIVLEHPSGRLVGIEVKASETIAAEHLRGLKALAQATGKRFHRGVLLYLGREVVPFGPRLHVLPVAAIWRWAARAGNEGR
ncbi:MAG: ATP-binding protein [Acidobacteria bacterium]|nr:ATP-binding protein [Acidobacteriota bacterium]